MASTKFEALIPPHGLLFDRLTLPIANGAISATAGEKITSETVVPLENRIDPMDGTFYASLSLCNAQAVWGKA